MNSDLNFDEEIERVNNELQENVSIISKTLSSDLIYLQRRVTRSKEKNMLAVKKIKKCYKRKNSGSLSQKKLFCSGKKPEIETEKEFQSSEGNFKSAIRDLIENEKSLNSEFLICLKGILLMLKELLIPANINEQLEKVDLILNRRQPLIEENTNEELIKSKQTVFSTFSDCNYDSGIESNYTSEQGTGEEKDFSIILLWPCFEERKDLMPSYKYNL